MLSTVLLFTYFNHTRTKTASAILLIFWPIYIVAVAAWTRTIVSTGNQPYIVIVALRWTTVGIGALSYVVESMGSQMRADSSDKENPVLTANAYSLWVSLFFGTLCICANKMKFQTFSWMTPLMKKGASEFITEEDLFPLVPADESVNLGNDLKRALERQCVILFQALVFANSHPARCGKLFSLPTVVRMQLLRG